MAKLVALFSVFSLLTASPVLADQPSYSFASAQGSASIAVEPGGEGVGLLFFYNIDGNRVTHIGLRLADAPAGALVNIEPAPREVEIDLSGERVVLSENLFVEPGPLLVEPLGPVPEGSACIELAKGRFAIAKVARVLVRVPSNARLGPAGKVKVTAEASWLGQSGAAALKQSRTFEFTVEVVRRGPVTERVLGEVAQAPPASPPPDTFATIARLAGDNLPAFAAGALALLAGSRLAGRLTGRRRNPNP